ncbi:SAV_2336 family protein [Streptomyces sp. NBC_00243]|uniref:SAV_2336 N-terminal domain-related protein n=1 Tax=Streptomyces sp. NBC_00243 TaxID=2975688 RepID=UPI002DDBAC67|nr:SAV_2336 N-terminal domain-related protein [Streptomyces sp. NBC_00243]WRZ22751.1 SAV_2336 family protein [Streptomyces sp. NBC_00243]
MSSEGPPDRGREGAAASPGRAAGEEQPTSDEPTEPPRPAGHPDPGRQGPAELAELLGRAAGGAPPASVELAELLWLAGHIAAPREATPAAPRPGERPAAVPRPPARAWAHQSTPKDVPDPPAESHRPDDRVPLLLPGPATADGNDEHGAAADEPRPGPHTTLLAPAPPMLPHPLAIQRTLRPLKRRVDAPVGQELDEEATAHRIARLGAAPRWWVPVLRPTTERWLTLHLVYDSGPTMPVWRPLVRELHAALAQSGVFRTVELHRLTADGTVVRPGSQESYAAGRTVTLLVSDCMGPQWRSGPAGTRWYRTLRRWAAHMPVAVLQPLPERLWRTTALPATTARITSPWPAAPNSTYAVDSYATDADALPLPVLEPSAPWLANWSSLVAGSPHLPGSIALLDLAPPPAPVDEQGRSDVEQLSPEELVLRFRSIASPEAFRLAGHLAVGRPELPVMRLVQAAIEKNPQPRHLAEVILSGVLSSTPGAPGSYAFRPGVRELLLHTLPRTAHSRTSELLSRIGALIDARAGMAAGEFPVLVPGQGDASAGGEPFATVREESVRRLGGASPPPPGGLVLGRYRIVRRLGRAKRVMLAEDTRADRTVVVTAYSEREPLEHGKFLQDASALAAVDHPNVIAVYDFGVEGDIPYLVTEFVEGLTLAELTAEGGFGLPIALLAPLAQQVAGALKALHEQGVAHGRLTPNGLLIRPDDTVKIINFALGRTARRGETTDLDTFGHLLRELARGVVAPELGGIPGEFRAFFDDALTPLTSSQVEAQRRGRDLFLTPSFSQVIEAAEATRYRYQLLGRVLIRQGGRTLPAFAPREQALLCMLLLQRGKPVAPDVMIRGLWGTQRPQRAERLLATYVVGLRKALGPGVLATTTEGYALHANPGSVDVIHGEDLVTAAKSMRDNGNLAGARGFVQGALNLWTGDPVDGVPGPAAESARGRLRALRLALCATRAELDLELGDFERAAIDLGVLIHSHPQREDFRRLRILVLKAQGRIAEAIEAYDEHERRQSGELGPVWRELYHELHAVPEDGRPVIVMECVDADDRPGAHSTLAHPLAWLLSLSGLASGQYDMNTVDGGYLVLTSPETSVLTVLKTALRELPGILLELTDLPRVRLTFWHTAQPAPTNLPADPDLPAIEIAVSPVLYEELMSGDTTAVDPALFGAVYEESSTTGQPLAWNCSLELPEIAPEPDQDDRDLVRGPFTTRNLRTIRVPEPGRAAIVHTQPNNLPLTLLNPNQPHGKRTSWPLITYYEVDLSTHHASHELLLRSSGGSSFTASVELSWHVDDAVAFVRSETADVSGQLLDHLVKEAGRITRRYPLGRGGAAQRAVREALRRWPVPGLSVVCAVRLREGAPPPQAPPPDPARNPVKRRAEARQRSLAAALDGADCVLLGFDGPLARLYPGHAEEQQAARRLAALLVELRHPDEALSGSPLGTAGSLLEGNVNPLDLLRALADHRLAADLRQELDRIEERAALSARPTARADVLISTLRTSSRTIAVVTDNSLGAVTEFLRRRAPSMPVHARSADLTLLMPNPDCLHRALNQLKASPSDAVLIGSSVAELTAAHSIGLPFIGYAHSEGIERNLTRAGCEHTVTSLTPILEAIRTG